MAILWGFVKDRDTGFGIYGIAVQADGGLAVTAVDGSYALELPVGSHMVQIRAEMRRPITVTVYLGPEGTRQDFNLEKAVLI